MLGLQKEQTNELKGMRADRAGYIDYLGLILGTAIGGGSAGAATGAGLGGLVGNIIVGAKDVKGAWGNVLPAILGIAGGIFGKIFDRNDRKLDLNVDSLEKNTDAVRENTRAVEELSQRLINAPSSFTIPSLGFIGGGGGGMSRQASLTGISRKYLL